MFSIRGTVVFTLLSLALLCFYRLSYADANAISLSSVLDDSICVVPSTYKVMFTDSCASLPSSLVFSTASIVMALGESEHIQVIVPTSDSGDLYLSTSITPSATCSNIDVSVYRVGYVYCNTTLKYEDSGHGWHADPLSPMFSESFIQLMGGEVKKLVNNTVEYPSVLGQEWIRSQPLWVRISTFESSTVGSCNFILNLLFKTSAGIQKNVPVNIFIDIFGVKVPSSLDSSYKVIMSFGYERTSKTPVRLSNYFYPDLPRSTDMSDDTVHQWLDFVASRRMPGDYLYLTAPRSVEDLMYIAESGATQVNLLDVSTGENQCLNFTSHYVDNMLNMLSTTVTGLRNVGAFNLTKTSWYVYGFDEADEKCKPGLYQLFGAVKSKFPELKTFAVLNWDSYPSDLPVDVLVQQYQLYNKTIVDEWLQVAGREYWQYWCIVPRLKSFLNTFIERPGVHTRLLLWLLASQSSGVLYYDNDLWIPSNINKPKPFFDLVDGSALSLFPIGNYIWTTDFANGDGQFIYPGKSGPIGSIRWDILQDGLEDAQIFRSFRNDPYIAQLRSKLVTGPTTFATENADVLLKNVREEVIRYCAKNVMKHD